MKNLENELVSKMNSLGYQIDTIWDFVNGNYTYKEHLSVLLEYLVKEKNDFKLKEGIIRALMVKSKNNNFEIILEEFKTTHNRNNGYKWVVASTLSYLMTKKYKSEILKIVIDKSHGISRQNLVMSLYKFKDEETENILIELLDDTDVILHAISALQRLRSKKAIPVLEKLINNKRSVVRRNSIKAIQKIKEHYKMD